MTQTRQGTTILLPHGGPKGASHEAIASPPLRTGSGALETPLPTCAIGLPDEAVLDRAPAFEKWSWIPGIRHRRMRVWAIAVAAICAVLMIQGWAPTLRLVPSFGGELSAWTLLIVFLAAMVCEYVDSSMGMGYGTTLTPLLLLAGLPPMQVVTAVLFSECFTGIAAGLMHHRDGNVDFLRDRRAFGTTLLLLVLTVLGVVAAIFVANRVSKQTLSVIITTIVLAVGVVILATARRQLRFRPTHIVALGAIAAFNKGISGGGYGPLVTGGQVVSGMSPKHAVAITSLAEGLTCLAGLIGYFIAGQRLDWSLTVPLTLGAMLSVPLATLTVRRLPATAMRICVGTATCILGVVALVKVL